MKGGGSPTSGPGTCYGAKINTVVHTPHGLTDTAGSVTHSGMNVVSDLIDIGFSEYEAKVYVALLERYPETGYQIGKGCGGGPAPWCTRRWDAWSDAAPCSAPRKRRLPTIVPVSPHQFPQPTTKRDRGGPEQPGKRTQDVVCPAPRRSSVELHRSKGRRRSRRRPSFRGPP